LDGASAKHDARRQNQWKLVRCLHVMSSHELRARGARAVSSLRLE